MDGRKDGNVTISLRNFVGEGIITETLKSLYPSPCIIYRMQYTRISVKQCQILIAFDWLICV